MPESQKQSRTSHIAPIAFALIAMLGVILLLPSALRPPPDRANQSAELSPDAPPDQFQSSIIQALGRGSTSTAGVDTQQASGSGGATGTGPAPGGTGTAPQVAFKPA